MPLKPARLEEHSALVEIKPLHSAPPRAVEDVLDAAFGGDRFGRTAYRIRAGGTALPALSFAAWDRNRLVGTLQSWPVSLTALAINAPAVPLVMVGPVAVLPDAQRSGVGTASSCLLSQG